LREVTTKRPIFQVSVVISNKEGARDPEGETILRDLVHRSGFAEVRSIRAGKHLRVEVEASDASEAESLVRRMCDDLRIYNPAAHSISVSARRP
jgi:phosphoribosylformylglycinamidine synthase subunit PurS